MSDYLGPKQTRVLDPDERNFEELVYQKRKPPLSCELDLSGRLVSQKSQETARRIGPSGWDVVGNIVDGGLNNLLAGDIACSPANLANAFTLVALDRGVQTGRLVAWVNGYRVLVQGTSNATLNNVIQLETPPAFGDRVDFVFLEVWRKLLTPSDTVKMYGNWLYGGTNPSNDLIDPAMGIETTLRVQVQYRLRVVSGIDVDGYPDGFDPAQVFVQGPLANPIKTCSHAYFSPVPGDPGLWIAGAGDEVAQETLETVDGHTYAIPMFMVARRNMTAFNPDTYSNGAGKSQANFLAGIASDRPDGLYNDIVVANDILDMRRLVSPEANWKELAESGFQKLIQGRLRGKMSYTSLGEDHHAVVMTQADAVSSEEDKAGSTLIARGDGARRIFSNAGGLQPETAIVKTVQQKAVGTVGAPWALGDVVRIDATTNYPAGTVIPSVQQTYSSDRVARTLTTGGLSTGQVTLQVPALSPLIGTSLPLIAEYTLSIPSKPSGLTGLPDRFLEFRKEDTTMALAVQGYDIPIRGSSAVGTTDGTFFNTLTNHGARVTEATDFGHQMVYHARGNGNAIMTLPRTIDGYPILGIQSAKVNGSYVNTILVNRDPSDYSINFGTTAVSGSDVELVLYTGVKFFDVNRQSRGITDCFEMLEITPNETPDGFSNLFTLDSSSRPVLALASYFSKNGAGYAYVDGSMVPLTTNNDALPTSTFKTLVQVTFATAPGAGKPIQVPVLARSAITDSEGYTCFYETTPYQGLLDSSTSGNLLAVGPSIVTTAGSGAKTDWTYAVGEVTFVADSSVVDGDAGTQWLSNVRPGDLISPVDANNTAKYVVHQVLDNETLVLTGDSESNYNGPYGITRRDTPYFTHPNIIDRLPILDSNADSSAKSDALGTAISELTPVLETRILSRTQDIADATSVWFGIGAADRGRSGVYIPGASLGASTLGLSFEKLSTKGDYQKTYQAYVLDKDSSGDLRLVVVGSETDNTSTSRYLNHQSTMDTVDIFHLPGRPLTARVQ